MKKTATFFLALSFLSVLTGCDFLRKVAGRPTEAQVEALSVKIEKAEKAKLEARLREEERAREIEAARQDSLQRHSIALKYGVNFSDVFRFGVPSSENLKKYNVIIGVYRYVATATKQMSSVKARGYAPFEITFPGGEYAVCLSAFDSLDELDAFLEGSISDKVFPKQMWIYVNNL